MGRTSAAAFGLGIYLVPVIFGVSGFWLVMLSVKEDSVDWRRFLGLIVAFLIALALLHVLGGTPTPQMALDGEGGGFLGQLLGQFLVDALGTFFTVALLVVAGILALVVASHYSFPEFASGVSSLVWRIRHAWGGRSVSLGQGSPLPSGELSWRTRLREWIKEANPIQLGESGPSPSPANSRTILSRPVESASPPAQASTDDPGSSGVLLARVIGGAQEWRLPPIHEVLDDLGDAEISRDEIRERARIIEQTLTSFGVPVKVVEANQGPAVTQFGLQPGYIMRRGKNGQSEKVKVKVSRIQALSNDLALALAASPIRIEAPVPGRPIVGLEVPNAQMSLVALRSILESEEFQVMSAKSSLTIALGRDVSGQPAVADLAAMPHLLIAGATGSGKSACINAVIATLLCTHTPETLRFLMIDPKMVELTPYNGIPHLIAPVVVEIERVVSTLQWATRARWSGAINCSLRRAPATS